MLTTSCICNHPHPNYSHVLVASESSVVYIHAHSHSGIIVLTNTPWQPRNIESMLRSSKERFVRVFFPSSWKSPKKRNRKGKKHFFLPSSSASLRLSETERGWKLGGFLLPPKKKWKKSFAVICGVKEGVVETYMQGTKANVWWLRRSTFMSPSLFSAGRLLLIEYKILDSCVLFYRFRL